MGKHYETIQNLMIFFMKLVINIKFYLCDMLIFNVVIICRKENRHYLPCHILFFNYIIAFFLHVNIIMLRNDITKLQVDIS